jgi:hypothetical protein
MRIRSYASSFACAAILACWAVVAIAQTRDPITWPFSSASIWNTPIGSNAVYVPIDMAVPFDPGSPPSVPPQNWAPMPGISEMFTVMAPTAPLTDINYNSAGWSGADRCGLTTMGGALTQVPIPSNYFVSGTDRGDNPAAFLMPDGRTLIQSQPFARCDRTPLPPVATSIIHFDYTDLYGDGRWGAHGGSQLSSIGGSIHVGELRPGVPVRHALALTLNTSAVLNTCSQPADCYRWPAYSADAGATDPTTGYGRLNPNPVSGMKMGALLAIPASVDINSLGLDPDGPGILLAWTLQNYGAYIVDSSGGPSFYMDADAGPEGGFSGSKEEEFLSDFGMPMDQRARDNTPWSQAIETLIPLLHLVDNNGLNSIGGGGTPLQPLAPALAITRIEEDSSAVSLSPSGAWVERKREVAGFNDGRARTYDLSGGIATFSFTGTGVSWIGLKCNMCGIADVSIDGGAPTPVDTAGPAAPGAYGLRSEPVFTASGLTAGPHTLDIAVTGNTTSGGAHIAVDAFDVTP